MRSLILFGSVGLVAAHGMLESITIDGTRCVESQLPNANS
jgi:hypothetical protein